MTPPTSPHAVRLALPFPPSVNALYRAVNGRTILSNAYRKWKVDAGERVLVQRPRRIEGPVSVHVALTPPDKRRRDLDNAFKAICDLLVTHRIIEGDDSRIVRSLEAKWADGAEPCVVEVRPL